MTKAKVYKTIVEGKVYTGRGWRILCGKLEAAGVTGPLTAWRIDDPEETRELLRSQSGEWYLILPTGQSWHVTGRGRGRRGRDA